MSQGTSRQQVPAKPTPREREMQALVRAFERDSVGLTAFCRQHDVSERCVTYWQRECRRRSAVRRETRDRVEPVDFVEVVAVPQPQPAAAAVRCSPTGAIRIVLPGWRHVEVEPGFDEMTLARTVQVLESLPC
jgi:hypothetical protein